MEIQLGYHLQEPDFHLSRNGLITLSLPIGMTLEQAFEMRQGQLLEDIKAAFCRILEDRNHPRDFDVKGDVLIIKTASS